LDLNRPREGIIEKFIKDVLRIAIDMMWRKQDEDIRNLRQPAGL
jgi:hypothetical protein